MSAHLRIFQKPLKSLVNPVSCGSAESYVVRSSLRTICGLGNHLGGISSDRRVVRSRKSLSHG